MNDWTKTPRIKQELGLGLGSLLERKHQPLKWWVGVFHLLRDFRYHKAVLQSYIILILTTGMQDVYISISGNVNNESFHLTASSESIELHGILCENGKFLKTFLFLYFPRIISVSLLSIQKKSKMKRYTKL